MRFRVVLSLVLAAFVALPATASASEMIARNATHVRLAVNRNNVALINYRAGGRQHHTLAWGAINARTPTRGIRQVSFRLDYSGGWGSRRKDLWRGFKGASSFGQNYNATIKGGYSCRLDEETREVHSD